MSIIKSHLSAVLCALLWTIPVWSQIGTRFPSERKVVKDPVTGTMLTFLTSKANGDAKIYQTHPNGHPTDNG